MPEPQLMRLQVPADFEILDDLQRHHMKDRVINIAERTGYHKTTVSKRTTQLEDYGLLDSIGHGVYLINDLGQKALENQDKYTHETAAEFEHLIKAELEDGEQ